MCERISIPQENKKKFKEVLLYILNEIGARPNVGKTVILKLLYFIDFDYYEVNEEQLIGARYIKNTYGPTHVEFDDIVEEMKSENLIEEIQSKYYTKEQTKYIPLRVSDVLCFNGRELEHIKKTIERFGDKSATYLSALSHKDIPWIKTKEKEEIPYEAVFYRTTDTSAVSAS